MPRSGGRRATAGSRPTAARTHGRADADALAEDRAARASSARRRSRAAAGERRRAVPVRCCAKPLPHLHLQWEWQLFARRLRCRRFWSSPAGLGADDESSRVTDSTLPFKRRATRFDTIGLPVPADVVVYTATE